MIEIKRKDLFIESKAAKRIKRDLSPDTSIEEIRKRYDKYHTEGYTVKFDNNIEMDIKLCCTDTYEDNSNPLWTEAVLFENGSSVAHSDPDDEFFQVWELEGSDGTIYQVNVQEIVTLKFEGYSDDTFGEYGVTNEDVDNCASLKPIQCLIEAGDEKLLVVGQFSATHIQGGCWVIGISMVDEDTLLPSWPIRFKTGEYGYSPSLEIDVPSDFTLTWFNNGSKLR